MNITDERNVDPIQEMTRIANNFLDLETWGFVESYRSTNAKNVIYDSVWCRVNLVWGGWDYGSGNTISIYYGRLHALNEEATMSWKGEVCHCWHRIELALHFLDRQPPEYAATTIYTHSLIEQYKQSKISQALDGKRRQPDWLAQMHRALWRHYGRQLFDVFDLRQPELWDKYRQFLKEVYDIRGRPAYIKPPLDKVC